MLHGGSNGRIFIIVALFEYGCGPDSGFAESCDNA
jgi:hypothetical protein